MNWLRKFLFITQDYCLRTKLWNISYAYLPNWIHRVMLKNRDE